MTTIWLGMGAYSRSKSVLPEVICRNQFAESVPASETGIVLLPRPALKPFAMVGDGPCRGFFREAGVVGGNFITVSGGGAYTLTVEGHAVRLGDVSGTNNVDIAGSGDFLVVADEDAGGYFYDGVHWEAIDFPDGAGISTVDYIDGYFVLGRKGSRRFYWTAVDAVTVDPLSYASKERTADSLVCVRVIADEVWLFGETSIEIWVPTAQSDLPFERVNGRVISRGCINRDTVAKLDNSLFWVGDDRIVYRGGGAVPLPISSNSIAERVRHADPAELRGWAFTWDGHVFYALTVGDQGTYCFDVLTGQWSEFASYGRTSWRAHFGAYTESVILAGDDTTGNVWQLSDDVFVDAGADPLVYEVTGILPISAQRVPNSNFAVDIAVGTAAVGDTDHYVEVRYSDDAGRTWSTWDKESLGSAGEYRTRVRWRQLGQMRPPGRVFHVRVSSPIRYRLSKAMVNERFP